MLHPEFPNTAEQRKTYARIFAAAGDRPVLFRTFDIGGDKLLPYFSASEDENPAMGWRALRIALDRPGMLCRQLRALIEAAGGSENSRIGLPLLRRIRELRMQHKGELRAQQADAVRAFCLQVIEIHQQTGVDH
ncbi:MAG: putative PEP-binding protein [Pseudomonadota bacterium]|nr:putative PEP-binding protein [Pseudomonadota bacterium]